VTRKSHSAEAQAGDDESGEELEVWRRLAHEIDAQHLYEQVERAILSHPRTLTRSQVAEQAGVDLDRAVRLWRALGFPGAEDDDAIFVEADVEALRLVTWLVENSYIDEGAETSLVRSMGRTYARLAEWEVSELTAAVLGRADDAATNQEQLEELVVSLVPVIEDIQNYVWRRHVASAAGRLLLRPEGGTSAIAVGFADIVGYTRQSRSVSPDELSRMLETFESIATTIITDNDGRVIKTIGDEILFVADDPRAMARIALALVEVPDADFPELRVGAAYGAVLSKLGDVFGSTVNIASRLTSLSRPGKILIDRGLGEALGDDDEFRVRRSRNKAVRGYSRLETYTLKRPRERGASGPRHPGRAGRSHAPSAGADLARLPRTAGPGPLA
jgi:adenylate cyclase